MKRTAQIFALFLAIVSLFAPASSPCSPLQSSDHPCCAPQTELIAPSCCQSIASPQFAIPSPEGNKLAGKLSPARTIADWVRIAEPGRSQLHRHVPPPTLAPATILRT
jgi:hypothetical protein